MKRFKVTLEKGLGIYEGSGDRVRNPFMTRIDTPGLTCKVSQRTWEFDAVDEAQARNLYNEAVEQDIPGVRGYKLACIEEIQAAAAH